MLAPAISQPGELRPGVFCDPLLSCCADNFALVDSSSLRGTRCACCCRVSTFEVKRCSWPRVQDKLGLQGWGWFFGRGSRILTPQPRGRSGVQPPDLLKSIASLKSEQKKMR